MANNVQTAAEWTLVVDQLNQKIDQLYAQQDQLDQQYASDFKRFQALKQQQSALIASGKFSTQEYVDVVTQIDAIYIAQDKITAQKTQLSAQILDIDQQVFKAERQADIAKAGPPNDNSTVQPAGASPNADSEGSNTEVVVTPVPEPSAYTPQIINVEPTGGFEGNAIPRNLATTIDYQDGITTKTQEFGKGVTEVQPEDNGAKQADENAGFVFDPVTGEMVPSDSAYAQELRAVNPGNDPAVPNEDGVAEGGNTAATADALREPRRIDTTQESVFDPRQEVTESVFAPEPIPPDPNAAAQSAPYDELGNLNPGWNVDEQGTPYWVGYGEVRKDSSTTIPYRGPSRDDNGNLMPGWEEGEFGDQYVGDGYASAATQASADQSRAAAQKIIPLPPTPKDWRVRISLAKGSNYLYNYGSANQRGAGILEPLRGTGGVVFPYLPSISVSYNAKYDTQTITHSNYNIHNYTGSSVDQISITGDFTAQDTTEAAYMLAVIHFFRSATKMFYGQDNNPNRGTPPPLLYLSGHGNYQFDEHPMVLTNFTYALPVDVDYINAYPDGSGAINSIELAAFQQPNTAKPSLLASGIQRLTGSGLQPGGMCKRPVFQNRPAGADVVTRVPTKISISLTFLPIVTRNAITNHFSLQKYATGALLRGSVTRGTGTGGGMW